MRDDPAWSSTLAPYLVCEYSYLDARLQNIGEMSSNSTSKHCWMRYKWLADHSGAKGGFEIILLDDPPRPSVNPARED